MLLLGMLLLLSAAKVFSQTAAEVPPVEEAPGVENTPLPNPQPQANLPTLFPDEAVFEGAAPKERAWKFLFSASAAATVTDNLFIQAREKESDFSISLSPKIGVGRGEIVQEAIQSFGFTTRPGLRIEEERASYFFASYAPRQTWYLDHPDENSLEHDAALVGVLWKGKLKLGIETRFQTLSGPDIDVGSRTDRSLFTGEVVAAYELTGKIGIEAGFRSEIVEYQDAFSSSRNWTNQDYLTYQISPKVRVGLGVGLGYLESENGAAQVYEQALTRVQFQASEKLSFTGVLGAEARQISGGDETVEPIFTLGVIYRPRERTSLILEARRQTYSSGSRANENNTVTAVSTEVRQQVFQRIDLALAAGVSTSDYQAYSGENDVEREDTLVYVRPSLGLSVTRFSRCELSYEFRDNDSSLEAVSFSENVASLELKLLF
jgi:hypothetical protein